MKNLERSNGFKTACAQCQKNYLGQRKTSRFCSQECRARWIAKHRRTTTGRTVTTKGYVMLYLPSHPAAKKDGYVMEHRIVMEKILGRFLQKGEVVHHLNGLKADNREVNLQVMLKRDHDRMPKAKRMRT